MSELPMRNSIPVAVCETQPLTADGVAAALVNSGEFHVVLQTFSLDELRLRAPLAKPRLALIDKASGLGALRDWLVESPVDDVASIVWGTSITEAETVKLMHAGVRGVLLKSIPSETLLACMRAVSSGQRWMEGGVIRARPAQERPRSELTPREQQVMTLVQGGLRNRDIASELGIRPGTVKIHLKHIFEKTGIRGRYGLALNGLQHRAASVPSSVHDFGRTNGSSHDSLRSGD